MPRTSAVKVTPLCCCKCSQSVLAARLSGYWWLAVVFQSHVVYSTQRCFEVLVFRQVLEMELVDVAIYIMLLRHSVLLPDDRVAGYQLRCPLFFTGNANQLRMNH